MDHCSLKFVTIYLSIQNKEDTYNNYLSIDCKLLLHNQKSSCNLQLHSLHFYYMFPKHIHMIDYNYNHSFHHHMLQIFTNIEFVIKYFKNISYEDKIDHQ